MESSIVWSTNLTKKGNIKSSFNHNLTPGVLVFASPCGVVLDVKELFNSEGKEQVYGHLHEFLNEYDGIGNMKLFTTLICFFL